MSCHLIQDDHGRIKGYVLSADGRLRICLNRMEKQAKVLIGDGRREIAFSIAGDAQEKQVEWMGDQIESVRLETVEEEAQTERDFPLNQTSCSPSEKIKNENSNDSCKKEEGSCVYIEEKKRMADFSPILNRWPPPPCWQTADYVNGMWVERDD